MRFKDQGEGQILRNFNLSRIAEQKSYLHQGIKDLV